MEVGCRVVAVKRIELAGSKDGESLDMLDFLNNKYIIIKTFKPGSRGTITCTPPDKSFLHVLFDGESDPCGISAGSVRDENTPPSFMEQLRTFFA